MDSIYTIRDYITWSQSPVCVPTPHVCPVSYDTKRVTVEVTNDAARSRPVKPVLVSAIVTDPHALPLVGNPNVNNPLNNPGTTCTDSNGNPVVPCNLGLGNQTANTWYLTNTSQSSTNIGYTPPSGDNTCMHYTDQVLPLLGGSLNCGGGIGLLNTCVAGVLPAITGCPHPDLLGTTPPPSSIPQEFNFSPNPSGMSPPNGEGGRTILRDPAASSYSATPTNDARYAEWWATSPLGSKLSLSGNGGMTIYSNTLHGLSATVTLCIGVYLHTPTTLLGTTLLDPLNLLGTNTVRLGVAAYTMAAWPPCHHRSHSRSPTCSAPRPRPQGRASECAFG